MDRAILFFAVFLFGTGTALSNPKPLEGNISWNKAYKKNPVIQNYKHFLGDITGNMIYYHGTKMFLGAETELQLTLRDGVLSKALLILGPRGIDDLNCLKKYKKIVKFLNKKYGHFRYQKIKKDPIIEDLIHSSLCYPVAVGLYSIDTYWFSGGYTITSSIFGDEDGFYIEIEYRNTKISNLQKKEKTNKILESL